MSKDNTEALIRSVIVAYLKGSGISRVTCEVASAYGCPDIILYCLEKVLVLELKVRREGAVKSLFLGGMEHMFKKKYVNSVSSDWLEGRIVEYYSVVFDNCVMMIQRYDYSGPRNYLPPSFHTCCECVGYE